MSKPSTTEIANNRNLWREYVDPQDNDPLPMPDLDAAIRLIAAENPAAAATARAMLKAGRERKQVSIRLRVTPHQRARLQAAAAANGQTVSEYIREQIGL